jgi:hypothetical protein
MLPRDEVTLTEDGVPGDRAFFLVDRRRAMVSATRLGPLVAVVPEHDAEAGTLFLRFPDGEQVGGAIELGEREEVRFGGLNMRAQPVLGAFSAALSEHCGAPPRHPSDRASTAAASARPRCCRWHRWSACASKRARPGRSIPGAFA